MRLLASYLGLVVVAGWLLAPGLDMPQASQPVGIKSFEVSSKDFIIRGSNLAQVEVYFLSTGTEVNTPTPLGIATRASHTGRSEIWLLPIPPRPACDMLAAQVLASATDAKGNAAGTRELPCHGAIVICDAPSWCGTWIEDEDTGKRFTYSKGTSFNILLDPARHPQPELSVTCNPADALRAVPNIPGQDYEHVYTVRYEAVRKGNCKIRNRDLIVSVTLH